RSWRLLGGSLGVLPGVSETFCAGVTDAACGWAGGAWATAVREKLARASAAAHRVIAEEARGWVGSFIYYWVRRRRRLTGAGNALDARTLAAGRTAHAVADLRGVHVQLGKGAAERVAVHAQLFGGLALVALVVRKHFEDVTLFELANGFRIWDNGTVHLCDETIQFALQGFSSLAVSSRGLHFYCDPILAV